MTVEIEYSQRIRGQSNIKVSILAFMDVLWLCRENTLFVENTH